MSEGAAPRRSDDGMSRADVGEPMPTFLVERGEVLALRMPSPVPVARGALLVFGLAPALALFGFLLYAAVAPEGWLAWFAFVFLAAVLPLAPGGLGVALLIRAARGVEPAARIDLGERLLYRPGRAPEVFRDPAQVIVDRSGLGFCLALDELRVLDRVPFGRGPALAADARRLARRLDVEVRISPAAEASSIFAPPSPRTLAALAYVPLDPLPLIVSMFALATSVHPKTRFAALQSLLLLGVEAFLAGMVLLGLGLPLLLLGERLPGALTLTVLACPLIALVLVRAPIRVVAAMRAHRGEVWIMPWLAPIASRWVPAGPPATNRGAAPPRAAEPSRAPESSRAPEPLAPPKSDVLPAGKAGERPSTRVGAGPWGWS